MKLRKKKVDKEERNNINNNLDVKDISEKDKMNNLLYDVIDHDKLFNILYSGVEDSANFKILYDMGIRNFLISFHYVQKKKISMMREYSGLGIKFFVDSGAYTFVNSLEFKDYTLEQWEKYIEQYLRWAEDNSEFIFAIANLDLELILGGEVIQKWNEKYFEPFMLRTGIPVCFVHHEETSLSFDKYCERYPYVGISWGGVDKKGSDLRYGVDLLKTAEKYKCVVHGMAMTQTSLLTSLPFYTCDSSVDGKSSIVIKEIEEECNSIERISIEEFFNRYSQFAIQTTPTELRIPMESIPHKVVTVDNNLKPIWGDLKAIVKHTVNKKTLKFKIEGGKDLICTTDHSILTVDKEGNFVEVCADELKVGDYVIAPRGYNNEQPLVPFCETIIQKPNFSKERGELQVVEISDIFLEFLGLWIGDGCFYTDDISSIGLSCYQDKECREVIDTICNLYGIKAIKSSVNDVDVRLYSIRLKRIMINLGFIGNSHTKRIPKFIYSLSENQICHFLRGYFSADGTGTCECSTVSTELKNDLVELLEMMGIYTSISYRDTHTFVKDGKSYMASPIYHISIRDEISKEIFSEKIGFLQEYKNNVLKSVIVNKKRGARRTCIPKELAITEMIKTSDNRTIRASDCKGRISRKYGNGFSRKILDSQIDFLVIKGIEIVNDGSKEVEVYDLSVDNYERFVANGILVHNTTWMVGLQYGEINYWTGSKMTRLKKEKWKGEMLNALVKKGFNEQKLLEEDKEELIKVNVYAFIEAEKYVQERLKSRMYWLKPDIAKRKEGDLDNIDYPSVDFLRNIEHEDWKSVAKEFNISQEDSEEVTIQNAITDLTVFMNWDNEEYKEFVDEFYPPETITEIHNTWVNRIVSTEEEKIEDLQKFFKEVLLGENDKLLLIGTNFDRIVKERDSYISDEEYENVDVSDMEINNIFSKYLPQNDEAPEISSLDDEIFKEEGIVPIRDENGRFLKGQRKVLKPKKMYSKKYPKLACDMCFNAQKCPEYKAGYVCAYNEMFERYNTRDMADVIQAMQGLAEYQLVRVQRAMLTETVNGGMIDANTTAMMNQAMGMMQQLKSMYDISSREVLRQTKVLNSDGSQEITTSVSNPQRGGILEKIFGDLGKEESPKEESEESEVVSEQ